MDGAPAMEGEEGLGPGVRGPQPRWGRRIHGRGDAGRIRGRRRGPSSGHRGTWRFAAPSALGLLVFAEPLTATLFNYGKFDAHTVEMVARALAAYVKSLPPVDLETPPNRRPAPARPAPSTRPRTDGPCRRRRCSST